MDIYQSLLLDCPSKTGFHLKLTYTLVERVKPFTLNLSFVLTKVDPAVSVADLLDLVRAAVIAPLSQLQCASVKWQSIDLTQLNESNAPAGTSYHRRLLGLYGAQPVERLKAEMAFRYELRTLPIKAEAAPDTAPAQTYGLRSFNLRGVPAHFAEFDRAEGSDTAKLTSAASAMFVATLEHGPVGLRLKMPVQRPAVAIRLQSIASADPIGLLRSPIAGPKLA